MLGAFGRAAPTGGIDGTTNFGAPDFGTCGTVVSSASMSPIATHSASALFASMRPVGVGTLGRGSAGTCAGRGGTLGGCGFIASRACSSSTSTVLLLMSGSMKRSVMPTRPCNTDGVVAALTMSASPSIITPPSLSVTAKRPRRPAGIGAAIGMNRPFLSA